ncbi:CDP-diacylglycerol--glycerol-3-phosphate 3-phosphatidyltransferase [candidate division KSB1 bacterium]|nr:CDP-diacylglycerol--glycerol-3-phosphate 3-phosphatidyltransferase [candidate division KSB1 bacterium]MBL7095390.1 CDP-diacylglycerol--glycerol-3-phosphate 3-phosphatidyltransferase [candidate division KSB1 bacterium]
MNLANQLTVLRVVLTPIFLYFLFLDGITYKLISLVIFIIASLTDRYDGKLARKHGLVSKWGTFLDPLADKLLISSALFAFYYLGYVKLWMVLIIVIRDFLVTFLRLYAIHKHKPVVTRYLAKVKTTVQIVVVFVVFVFLLVDQYIIMQGIELAVITFLKNIYFIDIFMFVVMVLTAYTGIQYFIENRDHLYSIFNLGNSESR